MVSAGTPNVSSVDETTDAWRGWGASPPSPDSGTSSIAKAVMAVLYAVDDSSRHPDDEDGALLLDVTVQGVRCVLTRVSPTRHAHLSPRELEVARMVSKGYTNKAIALVLDISIWTVSSHIRRIFAKLDVASRAAMVGRLFEDAGAFVPR